MDKKKFLYTFLSMIALTAIIKLFSFASPDDAANDQKIFNDKYYVFSLNTPKNLSFAGERLPLDQFDVRERLDRELLLNTYWQSQTMLYHKRAARWFPIIAPILKRNGVPEDFKYLALAESGFTNVTSPSGAVGFWQFLDATAKSYGLEVGDEVDERYNVEKATEAACRYFKDAYNQLGSWTIVAGAYNMGIGGIRKQMEKQKMRNYYDLLLNDETFRYVFRVVALKEIISKPAAYGYHFKKKDLYAPYPYTPVIVDSSISNLVDFAESYKINYKLLKILNPWLRQNSLTNKDRKSYVIKILKPGFTGIDDGDDLPVGPDTLGAIQPSLPIESSEVIKEKVKEEPASSFIHRVLKGETLNLIAQKYHISTKELKSWNAISKTKIKAGQELKIFAEQPTKHNNN
jgi:membrane-bound lytic murein transglycosylase D